jgi:hypothetical protein
MANVDGRVLPNSKLPGPIIIINQSETRSSSQIIIIGQSETRSSSQIIFIILFSDSC